MYLPFDGYSIRPDTPEQTAVYKYIGNLANRPPQEAIDTFYRLLWHGNANPDEVVQRALKKIVTASDFERHRLKIINRCYYTLVNPWHLNGMRDSAVERLILWLENIPAERGLNPFTRTLRDTLRLYRESDHYGILKNHLHLLEAFESVSANARQTTNFGDLFSEYFFIYEAGTQTKDIEDASERLNLGVLKKRNKRLRHYHGDLARFYNRYARSLPEQATNPTRLADAELFSAINFYRPRRKNSFRSQSAAFKKRMQMVRTADEFKCALHRHILCPIDQFSPGHKQWFSREFQRTLDQFPNDVPLTRVVKILMFSRLLNTLVKCDGIGFQGDQFYELVTFTGPRLMTSILLNIVMSCEWVRFELEKRLARLHHQFVNRKNEVLRQLVDAFEHMNIAMALNAKYLGYFNLEAWYDTTVPDSM